MNVKDKIDVLISLYTEVITLVKILKLKFLVLQLLHTHVQLKVGLLIEVKLLLHNLVFLFHLNQILLSVTTKLQVKR